MRNVKKFLDVSRKFENIWEKMRIQGCTIGMTVQCTTTFNNGEVEIRKPETQLKYKIHWNEHQIKKTTQ